jgi:predicted small metal-binding protein
MGKVILCRDVGFDFKGVIRAESEEEAIDHARTVHGLTEIADEVAARVRAAVSDE